MTKSETINIRCTKELKNAAIAQAKAMGMGLTDYIESLVSDDLRNTDNLLSDTHLHPDSVLYLSLPECYGITMYINGDEYDLFPNEGRLTDAFLDYLLNEAADNDTFSLLDSPDNGQPVKLQFNADGSNLLITHNQFMKYYPVSMKVFKAAILEHFRKYAIYFAAPYNYRAIMNAPFDEMVNRMERYRPIADKICAKINQKYQPL